MPLSQNHRQARWELKAITALRQFTHSLNLKSWESGQHWTNVAIKEKIYIEAFKIAYDNLEKMGGTQNRLALV